MSTPTPPTPSASAPDLSGEPGWEPLTPFWKILGTRSFVSSEDDNSIRVRYYQTEDRAWARAWFGPSAEGPPGHVHGGAKAALLDEAMGMAVLATGRIVVAARIEVDFRKMVPLGEVVTVETVLDADEAREPGVSKPKVRVRATLRLADGTVASQSSGLFVEIGAEGLDAAGERLRGSV